MTVSVILCRSPDEGCCVPVDCFCPEIWSVILLRIPDILKELLSDCGRDFLSSQQNNFPERNGDLLMSRRLFHLDRNRAQILSELASCAMSG